ncbi:hypothetical protein VTO73DRAFT_9244 [Trametes versicolor]
MRSAALRQLFPFHNYSTPDPQRRPSSSMLSQCLKNRAQYPATAPSHPLSVEINRSSDLHRHVATPLLL